jgi:hypothetical protein
MFIPVRKKRIYKNEQPDYVDGWNECIDEMIRLINLEPSMIKKFGKVSIDGEGNDDISSFTFDFTNVQTTDQFIDQITMVFRTLLYTKQNKVCDELNKEIARFNASIKENTGE